MTLFNHKKRVSFSDIVEGILVALNETRDMPQELLEIKDVDISFQIRIQDMVARAIAGNTVVGRHVTYDDLRFLIEKIEVEEESMKISISFGRKNAVLKDNK